MCYEKEATQMNGRILKTYQIELSEDKAVFLFNTLTALLRLDTNGELKVGEEPASTFFSREIVEEFVETLKRLHG